ncbi:hypothetical protein ACFV2H_33905 [Streptomyces sp. NPDC059629]|uniref:hypothetical protein n=1 Tax=Streptomyces sp. NPDC059629 TaxID=3346889 RepID=UPI0036BA53C3
MCSKAMQAGLDEVRRVAKSSAYEARIIEEFVQPLGDPVRRAEWTYPYHVAALARQYRIATTPAHRKDAILKLVRSLSQGGATFGTWEQQIEVLVKAGPPNFRN